MKRVMAFLRDNHETVLYMAAAGLLLLALVKPQIQLQQKVHNYLLLADVSQSMNAEDVMLDNKIVSRMAYTRHLMKNIVETSPCGTYISVGVFASSAVALLVTPLEVCKNYDVLNDSIDHLEWRMAWQGDSRLGIGVRAAAGMFDYLNVPAKLMFFTDGDEAPTLNVTIKQDLSGVQMGENLVVVGVGGPKNVPVPRYNAKNTWLGYWPSGDNHSEGGGVTYTDTSQDEPDPPVASADFDRYLSSLDAEYLNQLASEINGKYIAGQDSPEFYDYVQAQEPAASFVTAYSMRWVYLSLAALLIILTFLPNMFHRWRARGEFELV